MDYIKHRDYKRFIKEGWKSALWIFIIPILGFVCGLICITFVAIWFASFFCCKGKPKQDKFEKKFDCLKVCTNYCVVAFMILVFFFGGMWLRYSITALGTLKPISCTVSFATSELDRGIVDTQSFFPGLRGYLYLLTSLNSSLTKILTEPALANHIKTQSEAVM